ncbi:MAG: hypothetical protein LDLANPLL_02806 [Turneriella sp.]|nr:hypothetical protein [Turneriella sp.]
MKKILLQEIAALFGIIFPFIATNKVGAAVREIKPKEYFVWIVNPQGRLKQYEKDFLERQLENAEVAFISTGALYKAHPNLPTSICKNSEYFLFSPEDALLQIGCLGSPDERSILLGIKESIEAHKKSMRAGVNLPNENFKFKITLPRQYR